MKQLINYPGGKWRLATWIISHFPPHHSYLEPFLGSGAVLFNKPRSHIETVNDLDDDIVNLFDWIRRDPEKLARALYYTPYSRTAYQNASSKDGNSLERAVRFCVRLNQSRGFRALEATGWCHDLQGRERGYAALNWQSLPELVIEAAERLRGVQIEHMDAIELIKKFNYPNVLIYCDPPYLLETRRGKQYDCEMTDEEHEKLLEELLRHQGPVLISGYESELYQDKLSRWHREEQRSYSRGGGKRKEILWMNFEPEGQMKMRWRKNDG